MFSIGEYITNLEKKGEQGRFIIAMEESYGYLVGTHARDKDAVVASMPICEMAAFYKEQGKTLVEVLAALNKEHGMYLNTVLNFAFEGESGMKQMQKLMDELRADAPNEIAGLQVLKLSDYALSEAVDKLTGEKTKISLPQSNVLAYKLPEGSGVIVRPSGTEPKIKVYITARAVDRTSATRLTAFIETDIKRIMKIEEK